MLQLNTEQVQRLQAIKLERDIARLAQVLALAFPDVPGRLGDRYALLVAHGMQRGAAHGLTHGLCVARLLACWFVLGAEFEAKPGYEWAQEILASTRREQGAKVFQLCRRSREELARLALQVPQVAGLMAAAAFDQAMAGLDAALMQMGTLGSLLPGFAIALGEACDIDALDLRLVEAATPQAYRVDQGQWQRVPGNAARTPITLAAGAAAGQALSPRLNLLSPAAGRDGTKLRLRTRAGTCCDPKVHPLVTHNGAQGLSEWRGPHAADILLGLQTAPPAAPVPEGDALQPIIAAEGPAQLSLLELSSCGLRENGQPLGSLATQLAVYPAEQHLMAWRREPGPVLSWPEEHSAPPLPVPRLRLERDGVALEATRWQAGLADLDRQLVEGLGRLATAWERESGVSHGRLQAEPRVLCGSAGISWGWAEGPQGLLSLPCYRVAGVMDLMACQLNLRLSGALALHGSLSKLSLHCAATEPLKLSWERKPADADLLAVIAPAQAKFRHPFVLELEALAQDELAVLGAASPVAGALVGACGLRQRPEGSGLQWFAQLSIEPVAVKLQLHDPLLGQQDLVRPLLPALTLLDWKLG